MQSRNRSVRKLASSIRLPPYLTIIPVLLIYGFIASCMQEDVPDRTEEISGKIFTAEETSRMKPVKEKLQKRGPFWTPSTEDIRSLEILLPKYVAQNGSVDGRPTGRLNLSTYKRQYFGMTTEGHPYIHINVFCDREGVDYNRDYVLVLGGGSCFFRVNYDPASRSFFDLEMNSAR